MKNIRVKATLEDKDGKIYNSYLRYNEIEYNLIWWKKMNDKLLKLETVGGKEIILSKI